MDEVARPDDGGEAMQNLMTSELRHWAAEISKRSLGYDNDSIIIRYIYI